MTRKKIAYLYYRNWAYEILKHIHQIQIERKDFVISDVICLEDTSDDLSFLDSQTSIHYVDPTKPNDLINIFKASNAKLVFCYSWSWIIPSEIVDSYHCICLHPSKLPEYRGGSPIQNQVLDGVLDSAVTVFKMNSGKSSYAIFRRQTYPNRQFRCWAFFECFSEKDNISLEHIQKQNISIEIYI